jgi:hypothetical protein
MKKILLVALFFTFGQQLFAQEGTMIGVSFGPIFNSATPEVNGRKQDGENGVGTRIAINYRKGFSENYGIQTGISLTTKAYGDKDGVGGKAVLSAIEIPIGISLRTNEISDGLFISGFVGPTLDVYVSARRKTENDNVDAKKSFNSIGSTIKFGTAVEKEFDFGTVSLGLSYNRGLTDLSDSDSNDLKVHYFAIEAGFFF